MNQLVSQSNAILSFMYDYDLLGTNNIFLAKIDFTMHGKRKITKGRIQIVFDSEDSHVIIRMPDPTQDSQVALHLDSKQHHFEYQSNHGLYVTGIHDQSAINKFNVSIFPIALDD